MLDGKTIGRENNFNLLRFVFASLVLVSHSYEILDGNRFREPLTRLFGELSSGELAVDGFFMLSGFLVAKSWENTPSAAGFFAKRVRRVIPGFIVAYVLSLLVFGFVGWHFDASYYRQIDPILALKNLVLLRPPYVAIAFPASHYDVLNGSMWTVQFEIVCYAFLCALGVAGLFRKRWPVLALALLFIVANVVIRSDPSTGHQAVVKFVRLAGVFLTGSAYFLYIARIRFTNLIALSTAVSLFVLMYSKLLAEASVSLAGAYLLLYFAFRCDSLKRYSMSMPDYSYGIYLYGWPAEKVTISVFEVREPSSVILISLLIAVALGAASWHFIERPFLRSKSVAFPLRSIVTVS